MTEDELKKIWAGNQDTVQLNLEQLAIELKHTMAVTERRIRSRDRREIAASCFGMVGFTAMLFYFPWPITKVACAIAIAWFGYVIYRLRRASRLREPDVSLPMRDQLQQRKAYLQTQAHLLHSALYWYVLPPFVMNVIFFAGIGDPSTWDSPVASVLPETLGSKIFILSCLAVFYGYLAWMNRKAAKTYYPPLIADLDRVAQGLQEDPGK